MPADSPDPTRTRLDADLPNPYEGMSPPSSDPPADASLDDASLDDAPTDSGDGDDRRSSDWTKAEQDALRLSDDDLDLVAGGLTTPLHVDSARARRLFRSPSVPPDDS